jgi:protein-S-isoprenylcysteine O-methyltransferase Ste14
VTDNRIGAWLFRHRSALPVPIALALVFLRFGEVRGRGVLVAGALLVAAGQALRFWAVRHIGTISRTRTTRYGPLITDGPYAFMRNPLYVGNWFLWTGFVVWSGLLWMLPVAWLVFVFQYGAIAGWEASFMRQQYPAEYDAYAKHVPRWLPRLTPLPGGARSTVRHPWRTVLFSERGTLIADAVMAALLTIKAMRG